MSYNLERISELESVEEGRVRATPRGYLADIADKYPDIRYLLEELQAFRDAREDYLDARAIIEDARHSDE